MGDDENRVSQDRRRNGPSAVMLRDGECIERVADTRIVASDDLDFAVEWVVFGDRAHRMNADDWLQNIRALRH